MIETVGGWLSGAAGVGDGGSGIAHVDWHASDNAIIGNVVHDIGPQLPDGLSYASYCR